MALNTFRFGILLLVLASLGFASVSILSKLAYSEGATPFSVLVFRNLIGAIAFVPIAIVTVDRVAIKERFPAWLAVGLLWALSAGAFYWAISIEKVSEVAPIVYLFPGIVILIERLVYREILGFRGILAIGAGMLGSILVLGQGLARPATIFGGGLALLSAAATACQYVVAAHKVRRGDQLATAAASVCVSAIVFAALGGAVGLPTPSGRGWMLMGTIAVVGTVMTYLYLVGILRAGASRAAMVSVLEPLIIVLLALLVLRETIGIVQAVGIALILLAFVVASTWIASDKRPVGRVP